MIASLWIFVAYELRLVTTRATGGAVAGGAEAVVAERLAQVHADGFRRQKNRRLDNRPEFTAIAFHLGHDASVAVGIGGRVQCVLELERFFNIRYYPPRTQLHEVRDHWRRVLEVVQDRCECDTGAFPTHFDVGLYSPYRWHEEKHTFGAVVRTIIEERFMVERWQRVDHHEAHARLGFFASPFKSALIVSMDAGGNDGFLNAYLGSFGEVTRLARLDYNLGLAYDILAFLVPEVTGWPLNGNHSKRPGRKPFDVCKYYALDTSKDVSDAWAGKLMGYAATARPREDLVGPIMDIFLRPINRWSGWMASSRAMHPKLVDTACEGVQGQRAVAATTQLVFQRVVHDIVEKLLPEAGGQRHVDGIVLTGGCSLNVLANQLVEDSFGLPVYVPPAPNDGGISVGALWAAQPPRKIAPLQYLGFPLWDLDSLERHAEQRSAIRIEEPEDLANILVDSNPDGERPIVAVVRGRQELGPRALGHRSLLVVPDSVNVRDRLNRLKHRQWYRPVAPMVAVEALAQVFGRQVISQYMDKAPEVTEDTRRRFPGLAHVDGTARHQSVSRKDEPWLHALLTAVGEWTGLAALINTSFNTKGEPIVNLISSCLEMLDTLPDLDMVLIEDRLFAKNTARHQEHLQALEKRMVVRRSSLSERAYPRSARH